MANSNGNPIFLVKNMFEKSLLTQKLIKSAGAKCSTIFIFNEENYSLLMMSIELLELLRKNSF